MKKASVNKNYILNILNEIFSLLIPLVTTPYVSRVIGAEGIGSYSYANSIVTYFAVFATLGTTVYGRREIAYKQDNCLERSKTFYELMLFRLITIIVGIGAYCIYLQKVDFDPLGVVLILHLIYTYVDVTWFYQGMEQFGTIVLRNIVVKLFGVAFIFLFVKDRSDLLLYVVGLTGFPVVAAMVLLFGTKKYIQKVPIKILKPFSHLKGALVLFIPTITSQIYTVLDKTMIGVMTTTSVQNGYYEQSQKIVKICWTFVTTFAIVMSPRVANLFAKNEHTKIREAMQKSYRFVWFLSTPITFGLLAISNNLVPWFFGEEFLSVETLLIVFSFIVLPTGLSSITGSQFLVATNKMRWYNLSIILGAITNFTLNMILIPKMYALGAAIASVVAESVIAIIQIIYVTMVIKEYKLKDVFFGSKNYLIAGGVMFVLTKLLSTVVPAAFWGTLLLIITGIIIYFGTLFLLKDEVSVETTKKYILKLKQSVNRLKGIL